MAESPEDSREATGPAAPGGGQPADAGQAAARGAAGGGQPAPEGTAGTAVQGGKGGWDWSVKGPEFQRNYQKAQDSLKTLNAERDSLKAELEKARQAQEARPAPSPGVGPAGAADPFLTQLHQAVEDYSLQHGTIPALDYAATLEQRYGVKLLPQALRGQGGLTPEQVQQLVDQRIQQQSSGETEFFDAIDDAMQAAQGEYGDKFFQQTVEYDGKPVRLDRAVERFCQRANTPNVRTALLAIAPAELEARIRDKIRAEERANIEREMLTQQIPMAPGVPLPMGPKPQMTDRMKASLEAMGIPTTPPPADILK